MYGLLRSARLAGAGVTGNLGCPWVDSLENRKTPTHTDAAATASTSSLLPLRLLQEGSQHLPSSPAQHSSQHTLLTSSGLTTEGKILAREHFRWQESSGEPAWVSLLRSLSGGFPLTATLPQRDTT